MSAEAWLLLDRIILMGLVAFVAVAKAPGRVGDAALVLLGAAGAIAISGAGYAHQSGAVVAIGSVNAAIYAAIFIRFMLRR